jgi:serine/threonine protein kinase
MAVLPCGSAAEKTGQPAQGSSGRLVGRDRAACYDRHASRGVPPLPIDGSSPGSPPTAFGPFRVLHQVGAGTTGFVFRAHDPVEGRLVAVKAFRLDLTPERAAELAGALQSLAARSVSHPSIAAPIAAGVEDGLAWFAQAYVPAESLDSALRQYGPPPVADALTIITQLAGALDFAAAAGIVHGALHPRDVLVAPGETHLVDLGVAVALESVGVRAPVRRPYSAPERAAGQRISREGDIFALGAIAFELLAGQPVTGAGDEAIVAFPDIDGANREALLETFSFALALAPDERYASGLAFAAPLKKALGDALLRPAGPRRRRTPRPPEGLLPIDDPDARGATGAPADRDAGLASSAAAPGAAADRADAVPPDKFELLPRPDDVSVTGQSVPAPALPAVEPPRDVAVPVAESPDDMRYATFDAEAGPSPLDVAELNRPAEPIRRWSPREADVPEPTPIAARDAFDGVEEDLYSPAAGEPEPPGSTANRHDAYEPTPLDDVSGREPVSPARRAWLPLVAMLALGLVSGFAGGWLARGGRPEEAKAPPATSAPAPNDPTRPRDATDVAVSEPDDRRAAADRAPAAGAAPAPATSAPAAPAEAPTTNRATRPAPAAAAAPREARPSSRLVVRTRPSGARVEVNGRSRGTSPLTLTDLPYGRHTVRITQDGYTAAQRRVTLSARRPAQSLDVPLTRAARAPTPASRASASSGGAFVGSVTVESRPAGAQVFVDGRGVGVTPLSIPNVPIGSHVVRLELSRHKRWSTSIRVVAGERVRVAASLEEEGLQ